MMCSLCGSETDFFSEVHKRKYVSCPECHSIQLHVDYHLSPTAEKERYLKHHNDINDLGYQQFVYPIVKAVREKYTFQQKGLDFGSGTGPVITNLLRKDEYNIVTYDPFFDPNYLTFNHKYDYIVCCEVIEHFFDPAKEFKLLHSLLHTEGALFIKTSLYQKSINFDTWWYKNDPTHVFFYTNDTMQWIKAKFGYNSLKISKEIIVFQK